MKPTKEQVERGRAIVQAWLDDRRVYTLLHERIAQALADEAARERERCAKVCEPKVMRPPGHRGQWEGYGPLQDDMSGPECAAAIRSLGAEDAGGGA